MKNETNTRKCFPNFRTNKSMRIGYNSNNLISSGLKPIHAPVVSEQKWISRSLHEHLWCRRPAESREGRLQASKGRTRRPASFPCRSPENQPFRALPGERLHQGRYGVPWRCSESGSRPEARSSAFPFEVSLELCRPEKFRALSMSLPHRPASRVRLPSRGEHLAREQADKAWIPRPVLYCPGYRRESPEGRWISGRRLDQERLRLSQRTEKVSNGFRVQNPRSRREDRSAPV